MGLWNWVARVVGLPAPPARVTFSHVPTPIDSLFVDLRSNTRVSRTEALSVPYVLRGRNMLCSIATLPMDQLAPDFTRVPNSLLQQIDPDVPNVVTLSQTVEDLIFDAVAWWQVTARQADGYPMSARRLDPRTVSLDPPQGRSPAPLPSGLDPRDGVVWVDGVEVPWSNVIRFDSPNPPVLRDGARAIRRALRLDEAAATYATDPRALDYFTARDGMEPEDDDELDEFLADWREARRARSTGYVPWQYEYNSVSTPSPAELQLAELQKQAGLEIANLLGVDPEDLGISTTSRTYANDVDRRRNRVNDVLAPFMRAITDRLSMGDVTRRGYTIAFRLDDYLKSNPTERWGVYEKAKNMGAMDIPEIREAESLPPMPELDTEPAPVPAPVPLQAVPDPVTASRPAAHQFDGQARLTFIDAPTEDFSVSMDRRIIEGLIVPYGQSANGFRFERGSITWADVSRVKLLLGHDANQAIGVATELSDTARGIRGRFRVARGVEGDRALELAEDGVLDGLSVGVDFVFENDTVPDPKFKMGRLVQRGTLMETSLTPMPAYSDARVTRVAASRNGGTIMPCATCGHEHAPNVACQTQQQPQQQQQQQLQGATFAQQAPQGQGAVQPGAPVVNPQAGAPALNPQSVAVMNWTTEQWSAATAADPLNGQGVTHALMGYNTPAAQQVIAAASAIFQAPQVVNPTVRPVVKEPDPYRFDRKGNLARGSHEFSTDVFAAATDTAAKERVETFIRAQFNIATTDVDELNPTTNRPEMYVDQRSFQYPIWDAVSKGTLDSVTPFTFPKFNSASGLVANHTQGAEPTTGSFTTTNATVTPTPVSGKVTVNRETWDQGGNPQISGLLWNQMTKGWYEALEAFAVSVLDAATPTGITLTTAAADDALIDELTNALALLNFVRGGFSMDSAFTQVDLYKKLVAAEDSTGRPLLPPLGPTNTVGTARGRWSGLDVNGVAFLPAWALAATGVVAASSYLFDRMSVWAWASAPQRLQFEYQVATIDIGLWGYKAGIITDITGVREIIYDPV
jgi:HK97 family phage prohead protease